jgi:hypothetical protein
MKTKVVLSLFFAFRAATACDCEVATVEQSTNYVDVIFRGTITEIKKQTVYFSVARVWKGNVEKVFTMPEFRETTFCIGFWPRQLRVGNELLVDAKWYKYKEETSKTKGDYFTDICTRTQFANDAKEDFSKLGPGFLPLEVRQPHVLIWTLLGLALFGVIGGWFLFQRPSRRSLNPNGQH